MCVTGCQTYLSQDSFVLSKNFDINLLSMEFIKNNPGSPGKLVFFLVELVATMIQRTNRLSQARHLSASLSAHSQLNTLHYTRLALRNIQPYNTTSQLGPMQAKKSSSDGSLGARKLNVQVPSLNWHVPIKNNSSL